MNARALGLVFVLSLSVTAACGIDATGKLVETAPSSIPVVQPSQDAGPSLDASDETTITVESSPLCDPNDATLIACFGFDGSVSDESGTRGVPLMATDIGFAPGHEGLAAVLTTTPKSDLRFDPAPLNTAQMTIELWMKPASIPVDPARYMLFDQNGRFGMIVHSDATITCVAGGVTTVAATKATIGTWHHVACVHDGAMMTMYVDGKLESSVAGVALSSTTDFVGVGEDSTSAGDVFDGMLDNLRVWSKARSSLEIAASASR